MRPIEVSFVSRTWLIKAMNSSYITSAQQAEQLPDLQGVPEVAFVGRSNCGKSSLLNALLNRIGLARESKTPGRTQMVNFFGVSSGRSRLILADLPGYGYSAISRDVRHHWQALVEAYLLRPTIQELLFLVDARRAVDLDEEDLALLGWLGNRRPPVDVTIVLTKIDKASQKELAAAQNSLTARVKAMGLTGGRICPVSSLRKKGIDALSERILRYMEEPPA